MDYFSNYPLYQYSNFNNAQFQHNGAYQYSINHSADSWRRHAAMHHGARGTDSKPRLAKEEVDKLEREFQRNHKPNSSLKKTLAEEMRVDIARINNWFQNRRAKAKQEKRAQENEARRKSEQANETPMLDTVKEYYPDGNHHDDLRPSAAPFPPLEGSNAVPEKKASAEALTMDDTTQRETDYDETASESASFNMKAEPAFEDFPSVDDMLFPSQSPCDFSSVASVSDQTCQMGPGPLTLTIPSHFDGGLQVATSAESFGHFHALASPGDMDSLAPLSSRHGQDGVDMMSLEDDNRASFARLSHLSPESAESPMSTGSGLAFRSPPIDIAARRNTKRPAQLGVGCMRSYSYNHPGMKTGVEMPRRMDAPSPMRRVASATGPMHRGIQRSSGMGPRSPLYFDRNQDLLLQMASQTPIPQGPCSSVAPPTPNTPVIISQQARELTVSSEDEKPYTLQTGLLSASFNTDPTMRTPPDTPGMIGNYSSAIFPSSHMSTTFDYNVIDGPLITPGLGSFENEFPLLPPDLPSYVSQNCGSHPSTPVYPGATMGPTFFPSLSGGNPEYNWSDASTRSSPGQANRARCFQFTNMTAQDFHGE